MPGKVNLTANLERKFMASFNPSVFSVLCPSHLSTSLAQTQRTFFSKRQKRYIHVYIYILYNNIIIYRISRNLSQAIKTVSFFFSLALWNFFFQFNAASFNPSLFFFQKISGNSKFYFQFRDIQKLELALAVFPRRYLWKINVWKSQKLARSEEIFYFAAKLISEFHMQ